MQGQDGIVSLSKEWDTGGSFVFQLLFPLLIPRYRQNVDIAPSFSRPPGKTAIEREADGLASELRGDVPFQVVEHGFLGLEGGGYDRFNRHIAAGERILIRRADPALPHSAELDQGLQSLNRPPVAEPGKLPDLPAAQRLRGSGEDPQDTDFSGTAEDGLKDILRYHEWILYYP